MIYFFQPTDGGPVKIGCSVDVDARRRQLEAHYGRHLALLGTMPGGRDEERAVHGRFAHLRLGRTEQFRPGPDLMAFIGRPLLVGANPEAVEAMPGPTDRVAVIHLKGTAAYMDWMEGLHRTTHIQKATIFRLAVAEWAQARGLPPPPQI